MTPSGINIHIQSSANGNLVLSFPNDTIQPSQGPRMTPHGMAHHAMAHGYASFGATPATTTNFNLSSPMYLPTSKAYHHHMYRESPRMHYINS
jgi:hypothetical protein